MSYTSISTFAANRVGDDNVDPSLSGRQEEDSLSPVRGCLFACLLGAIGWTAILLPFVV